MAPSELAQMRPALRPGRIGTLDLPHRIVMGAMHLGVERLDDGGRVLAAFYVERARGGAGLMVTGGAAVSRVGAGGADYGILDEPAFRERLRRVAGEVHAAGGTIALQLFHAGRYAPPAAIGSTPVAPSAVYSRVSRAEPVALTASGIEQTLDDFARAGGYARGLGFDAVEIMGSEGYLVDQFLSPVTNQRDDEWGGDPARRRRFGVEVTRRVRDACGDGYPVIVRFSGADLVPGGTTEDEVLDFARALHAAGADALNIGIGWHESPVPTVQAVVPPGTWVPVAAAVKRAVGDLPVIASNRVNRLALADAVLADGSVDFVSMARPFLADPEFVDRSRHGTPVNVCIACNQACIDRSLSDQRVSCLVNPRAGHETEFPRRAPGSGLAGLAGRVTAAKRVAVTGGGPAGLSAARRLAEDGHQVVLFEASGALGGQFRLACRVPGKADYASTVDFYRGELERLKVDVRLGRPVTADDLDLLRSFDRVVVATGVTPRRLELPGADLPHVIGYPQAFAEGALGDRVVIIGGGGVAVDLAHLASHDGVPADAEEFRRAHGLLPGSTGSGRAGRSVTVLQRGKRLGPALGKSTRWVVLGELRRHGVEVVSGVRYERITPEGVQVLDAEGARRLVPADTVVVAAGQEPETAVADLVARAGVAYTVIGGARDAGGLDAVRAFADGLAAAEALAG